MSTREGEWSTDNSAVIESEGTCLLYFDLYRLFIVCITDIKQEQQKKPQVLLLLCNNNKIKLISDLFFYRTLNSFLICFILCILQQYLQELFLKAVKLFCKCTFKLKCIYMCEYVQALPSF